MQHLVDDDRIRRPVAKGKRVHVTLAQLGTADMSQTVQLTRVQPAGKKTMEATAWARGRSTEEEVVFQ